MSAILEVLTGYGALGCWVVFSIIRERILMKKMEEQSDRFHNERGNWYDERTRWMRILGRKMSDGTFDETQNR